MCWTGISQILQGVIDEYFKFVCFVFAIASMVNCFKACSDWVPLTDNTKEDNS